MSASTRSCARNGGAADANKSGQTDGNRRVPCFMKAPEKRCWDYTCSGTLPLICRLASDHPHRSSVALIVALLTLGLAVTPMAKTTSVSRRRRRRSPAIASSRSIPTTGRRSPRACSMSTASSTRAPDRTADRDRKVKLETGEVLQHQPLDAEVLRRGDHRSGRTRSSSSRGRPRRDSSTTRRRSSRRRPSATRAKVGA